MRLSEKNLLNVFLKEFPRYAVYGAGLRGKELVAYLRDNNLPMPFVVLDDHPNAASCSGVPVMKPTSDMPYRFDAIVIGTNAYQNAIKARVRQIFGDGVPVFEIMLDNFCRGERLYPQMDVMNTELAFKLNQRYPKPDEKIKIYFLLHSLGHFSSGKAIWNACLNDPAVETKIVYFSETAKKILRCEDDLASLNAPEGGIVDLSDYDVTEDPPHVVVMFLPYQKRWYPEWMRVPYYFKERGIRCVYISYGLEYDTSEESSFLVDIHFRFPPQYHAWRVYTCSPLLIKDFARYCPTGGSQVRFLGHPKLDVTHDPLEYPLPPALKEKIAGRKVLAWQIHHYNCNRYENALKPWPGYHSLPLKENARILDYLQNAQQDFFLLVTIHPYFQWIAVTEGGVPEAEVNAFLEKIDASENSAWCRDLNYRCVFAVADAFISENSSLLLEMALTQKPVLYLEDIPAINNEFGAGLIDNYYKGRGLDDVVKYLDMLRRGEDPLADARKAAPAKYIPLHDGKSGERIKDDIVQSVRREVSPWPKERS